MTLDQTSRVVSTLECIRKTFGRPSAPTREKLARLARLRADGATWRYAAAALGCSVGPLFRLAHRWPAAYEAALRRELKRTDRRNARTGAALAYAELKLKIELTRLAVVRTKLLELGASEGLGVFRDILQGAEERSAEDLARLSKGVRSIVGRFRL